MVQYVKVVHAPGNGPGFRNGANVRCSPAPTIRSSYRHFSIQHSVRPRPSLSSYSAQNNALSVSRTRTKLADSADVAQTPPLSCTAAASASQFADPSAKNDLPKKVLCCDCELVDGSDATRLAVARNGASCLDEPGTAAEATRENGCRAVVVVGFAAEEDCNAAAFALDTREMTAPLEAGCSSVGCCWRLARILSTPPRARRMDCHMWDEIPGMCLVRACSDGSCALMRRSFLIDGGRGATARFGASSAEGVAGFGGLRCGLGFSNEYCAGSHIPRSRNEHLVHPKDCYAHLGTR